MNNKYISSITRNAIICALYIVITILGYPLSFNALQFRFSEILILLCFFRKDYIVGVSLGCAIANLLSTLGLFDVLFGTIATILSCLVIMFCKQLAIACIFPVVFNAFIVGAELYFILGEPFWISVGWVALGEFVVMIIGYIIFMCIKKQKGFFTKTLGATQNLDFKF